MQKFKELLREEENTSEKKSKIFLIKGEINKQKKIIENAQKELDKLKIELNKYSNTNDSKE